MFVRAAGSAVRFIDSPLRLAGHDTAHGDQFGVATAIDGSLAVSGAIWDDDAGSSSGAAYLFHPDPNNPATWTELKKIVADDAAADDWFGAAVAVAGDTVLVGAPLADSGDLSNSGAVYIFNRHQGGSNNWGQAQKLVAVGGTNDDWFGWSVALDGDWAAVGAYHADDGGESTGAVYLFARNTVSNTWEQVARLTASDRSAGSWLGWSVALHAGNLLAGAPFESSAGTGAGAAYLFQHLEGTNWIETAKLTRTNSAAGDQLGWAVAVGDNLAVAGARLADRTAFDSGAVTLFAPSPTNSMVWNQITELVPEDSTASQWFGEALALRDNLLLVGVRLDDRLATNAGAAYLFEKTAAAQGWVQTAKLLAPDGAVEHRFGQSVALTSSTLLVGGFYDENPSFGFAAGAAYFFAHEQRPCLAIERSQNNLVVSWDSLWQGWTLQWTDALPNTQWMDAASTNNQAVFMPADTARFFRLRRDP